MTRPLSGNFMLFRDEKPSFNVIDEPAVFKGMPDLRFYTPVVDYDALWKAHELEPMEDFQEQVANLINPEDLNVGRYQNLRINYVTSPDIVAARAGRIPSDAFFQLAAIGVVETRDDQVLVGIRGGDITPERVDRFASGLYGLPPGGTVKFNQKYLMDPITDTIQDEFLGEIGDFEAYGKELIGFFYASKPGPTGIKFVSRIRVDESTENIQKTNRIANRNYDYLLKKGATKKQARAELREMGLPPDAWEHPVILGVLRDPDYIRYWLDSQPQAFSGIGDGALRTYALYLKEKG